MKSKTYYKANKNNFRQPVQFKAMQIVVDKKEMADEILSKAQKRGQKFLKNSPRNIR